MKSQVILKVLLVETILVVSFVLCYKIFEKSDGSKSKATETFDKGRWGYNYDYKIGFLQKYM